jgi:hypothetical protein
MISINVQGGLGNQIFQIYTVIAQSLRYHAPYTLLNTDVATTYPYTHRITYYKTLLKNTNRMNADEYKRCQFCTLPFENDGSSILSKTCHVNVRLDGYFQRLNLFDEFSTRIHEILNIPAQRQNVYDKYHKMYLSEEKTNVAIHFRLGDYKFKQEHHPLLSIQYYKNCMKLIDKNTNLLVFCEKEDETIVSQMLNSIDIHQSYQFIAPDMSDEEQLLLMSCCNVIIMANSTFSWWAAYFASSIKQGNNICLNRVCIPQKWFHENTDPQLIMQGWTVVDV